MPNRFMSVVFPAVSILLSGCALVDAYREDVAYPKDTAILIGDVPYQFNRTRCAVIQSIDDDGDLICSDAAGNSSPAISPASQWRRNLLEKQVGIEWASDEHQAFLYHMLYEGGAQRAVDTVVDAGFQAYGMIDSINSTLDSIDRSNEMDFQAAQMKLQGVDAYYRGGITPWRAHQLDVIQWRLNNGRYFQQKIVQPPLIP